MACTAFPADLGQAEIDLFFSSRSGCLKEEQESVSVDTPQEIDQASSNGHVQS